MAGNRHLIVILLVLIYALGAVLLQPVWPVTALLLALAPPLIWATVTDLRSCVIPDTASVCVAVLGMAYPFCIGSSPDPATLVTAVVVTLALALASEIYWRRLQTEALGLGDIKLIGAGTLVVGAQNLWLMILLAAAGGTLAALLARRKQQMGIPFGPFLAYAIFAVAAMTDGGKPWH